MELTFAERVAYQGAIEEVYWRHRIWPEDNPGSKPPSNALISPGQVEKEVEHYLSKTLLVDNERGLPISGSELQTEMDRTAAHTGQPQVLRELFAALGNDPSVIAECLARPILAEGLVSELTKNHAVGALAAASASTPLSAPTAQPYRLPEILDACADDTWAATTTVNAPDRREGHSAIWTGTEMIIWGGFNYSQNDMNTGARYTPATDSWIATSTTNAPSVRWRHSAVWTGREMIIWGGADNNMKFNTGGRYNPIN